jgi:hypothetical protein
MSPSSTACVDARAISRTSPANQGKVMNRGFSHPDVDVVDPRGETQAWPLLLKDYKKLDPEPCGFVAFATRRTFPSRPGYSAVRGHPDADHARTWPLSVDYGQAEREFSRISRVLRDVKRDGEFTVWPPICARLTH